MDTAQRTLGHWAFGEGSVRLYAAVTRCLKAVTLWLQHLRVLVSSWGLLKNTVEEKYWAHILHMKGPQCLNTDGYKRKNETGKGI